jgi:hypothetical protein
MRWRNVDGPGAGRQRVDDEAFAIDRNADHARAKRLEKVPGGSIARILHRNNIAGFEQHPADDVDCLLGAVGHENVVGRSEDAA